MDLRQKLSLVLEKCLAEKNTAIVIDSVGEANLDLVSVKHCKHLARQVYNEGGNEETETEILANFCAGGLRIEQFENALDVAIETLGVSPQPKTRTFIDKATGEEWECTLKEE